MCNTLLLIIHKLKTFPTFVPVKKIPLFILAVFGTLFLTSQKLQKPKLITGPVVGSVTKNSAKVWIAYNGKGKNALILGDTAEKKVYYPTDGR